MSKRVSNVLNNIYRKHLILAIFIVLAVLTVGRIGIGDYINRPRDLGTKLTYIGKDNTGCWLPVCDSTPDSTYYFATDMTAEELTTYFKHAKCKQAVREEEIGSDYTGSYIDCEEHGNTFQLTYYVDDSAKHVVKDYNLTHTSKSLVLDLDRSDYSKAKAAL